MFQKSVQKVISGNHLSREDAQKLMRLMMAGELSSVQIASLLTALRMKQETAEELIGFAEGMRKYATKVEHSLVEAVDTCGTGGDGAGTFNISTATALVAAAAGVPVAKHGNRAASSKCGSIDVLETLGIKIPVSAEKAQEMLQDIGISFLFAPLFHQAMKHVMPTRKELGFRTSFNLLGPLVNPASVKRQLLGVFDYKLTPVVAEVLLGLQIERALVVSSLDGLDEITVTGPTQISEVKNGEITTYQLIPEEVGLLTYDIDDLRGGDAQINASIIRDIFAGKKGAHREIVLLNTGAVLLVADRVQSIQEGIAVARQVIDSGQAKEKLLEAIRYTGGEEYVS